MSKKGFTLIEMLVVISLLALIFGLIIPRVVDVNRSAKERAFTSAKNLLVNAGEIYVQDNHYNMNAMSNSNFCVDVKTLIDNGYAEANVKNGEANCSNAKGCITSPVNNAILNNEFIEVSVVNGQYRGVWGSTLCENPSSYNANTEEPSEEICTEAVSFAADDWETIICNVKNGSISKYNLGDTKSITLLNDSVTHTLRIVNTGVNDPDDCITNSNYSHTACGFVIEFEDLISKQKMNNTSTSVGGWKDSVLRNYLNATVFSSLPSKLQNGILNTRVISGHGKTTGETNFVSIDKLYLLSYVEIYGTDYQYDTLKLTETRQLDYYKDVIITDALRIKKLKTTKTAWWLRCPYSTSHNFLYIGTGGKFANAGATSSYGISPAFRIG